MCTKVNTKPYKYSSEYIWQEIDLFTYVKHDLRFIVDIALILKETLEKLDKFKEKINKPCQSYLMLILDTNK